MRKVEQSGEIFIRWMMAGETKSNGFCAVRMGPDGQRVAARPFLYYSTFSKTACGGA
jgi:hypothetical protein